MKETELYLPVKNWLEEKGYDVYAEVSPKYASGRADIIAKNGAAICIVEMKTSLSLELLDQAYGWRDHAHYTYIAIPRRKKHIPTIIRDFLKANRIGLLEVDTRLSHNSVYPKIDARFNRPLLQNKIEWDKELLPQHKTYAEGGTNRGGYYTPYKGTMERVKAHLKTARRSMQKDRDPDGWVTIKEILNHCETHYAAPKSSLSNALRKFEAEDVEHMVRDGKLHFRIREVKV